jgi:hypothetical protein
MSPFKDLFKEILLFHLRLFSAFSHFSPEAVLQVQMETDMTKQFAFDRKKLIHSSALLSTLAPFVVNFS